MPEGPEVKNTTDRLNVSTKLHWITNIYTNLTSNKNIDNLSNIIEIINKKGGIRILSVQCKGKFIYFELDDNWYIFNTLGMSGMWMLATDSNYIEPSYKRITLQLEDSAGKVKYLFFSDKRSFGNFNFVYGQHKLNSKLNSLGLDLLNDADYIKFEDFKQLARRKNNKNICKFLMDQKYCAGVGNYIKAESLFLSKISPWRKVKQLSDNELYVLMLSIKNIINRSFKNKGATITDYYDADGQIGKFQFNVYNQPVDQMHGYVVARDKTPDSRTTHWVPEIQK